MKKKVKEKSISKKFLDVSRCSRAKQRQRNIQKKYAARAKLLSCSFRVRFFGESKSGIRNPKTDFAFFWANPKTDHESIKSTL